MGMTDLEQSSTGLLQADEPPAFEQIEDDQHSPFVIACDHASPRIPRCLGTLGVDEVDRLSHIGWDIGISAVARLMAVELGARVFLTNYSRLVIDCNRPLEVADSVPLQSAGIPIPGNANLSRHAIEQRVTGLFRPYHDGIEAELARRAHLGRHTIYVALHSFTPVLHAAPRPWQVGVLYQRDDRLARIMLQGLRAEPGLNVGDNEPYRVTDSSDYSLIVHGERRKLLHVELELRQDLISDESGQRAWAELVSRQLQRADRLLCQP